MMYCTTVYIPDFLCEAGDYIYGSVELNNNHVIQQTNQARAWFLDVCVRPPAMKSYSREMKPEEPIKQLLLLFSLVWRSQPPEHVGVWLQD